MKIAIFRKSLRIRPTVGYSSAASYPCSNTTTQASTTYPFSFFLYISISNTFFMIFFFSSRRPSIVCFLLFSCAFYFSSCRLSINPAAVQHRPHLLLHSHLHTSPSWGNIATKKFPKAASRHLSLTTLLNQTIQPPRHSTRKRKRQRINSDGKSPF